MEKVYSRGCACQHDLPEPEAAQLPKQVRWYLFMSLRTRYPSCLSPDSQCDSLSVYLSGFGDEFEQWACLLDLASSQDNAFQLSVLTD